MSILLLKNDKKGIAIWTGSEVGLLIQMRSKKINRDGKIQLSAYNKSKNKSRNSMIKSKRL